MSEYDKKEYKRLGFKDFLIYITRNNNIISSIHDIPLYVTNSIIKMIVEIPKNTHYKLEISKKLENNPIKHDIKKNKIRKIEMPYPANYGAAPQTFEDPKHIDKYTGTPGDNDPIDVFDISDIASKTGDVIDLKVLGAIAMIDDGETDWKIIGINVLDAKANELHDIDSVDKNVLTNITNFLKNYKIPEGKTPSFGFDGIAQNKEIALDVIAETHKQWKNKFFYSQD